MPPVPSKFHVFAQAVLLPPLLCQANLSYFSVSHSRRLPSVRGYTLIAALPRAQGIVARAPRHRGPGCARPRSWPTRGRGAGGPKGWWCQGRERWVVTVSPDFLTTPSPAAHQDPAAKLSPAPCPPHSDPPLEVAPSLGPSLEELGGRLGGLQAASEPDLGNGGSFKTDGWGTRPPT